MKNIFVKHSNFEFGPVVQEEMSFKMFLIQSSGGPVAQQSGTICTILVERTMRIISVKSF